MQHPLEPGGAVHNGRLMLSRVHVGQGGNVDDGAPAEVLPVAGENVEGPEGGVLQEVGEPLAAQVGDDIVHQAVAPKEQLEHAHQHHQGDEVGGGENGLEELFRLFPRQGVEHQGDDDGQREADDKAQYAQQEGVFHQRPELDVGKEADEVVKANPDCGV